MHVFLRQAMALGPVDSEICDIGGCADTATEYYQVSVIENSRFNKIPLCPMHADRFRMHIEKGRLAGKMLPIAP